jgi:hypothetical protein
MLLLLLPAIGTARQAQTITFDAIPDRILGIAPFEIAARSDLGLPLTLTSDVPAVCTGSFVTAKPAPKGSRYPSDHGRDL